MTLRPKPKSSWFVVLLVAAAVILWAVDQKKSLAQPTPSAPSRAEKQTTAPKASEKKSGRYEVYQECSLIEARNNDGDSFKARLPDGRQAEFRLYFVDTPESAFKSYAGGDSNHERIRQQAADLGGITPAQAVEIGKKGKAFTLDLLASKPFTIYTVWDSPFHDNRYHAHVEVRQDGRTRWLHQILVEKGLARILTKPADLPDGTPAAKEKDHLRQLEREAKRTESGVWANTEHRSPNR